MRRLLCSTLVMIISVAVASPAAAQTELEAPSAEDAVAIEALSVVDDGFECPAVVGATARPYEDFAASGGMNGVEIPNDQLRMRCRYDIAGVGGAVVDLRFGRVGVRPKNCGVESLPYEAVFGESRLVDLGLVRAPLAINAEFKTSVKASDATVEGLRAAARVMADLVGPVSATCPTPLEIQVDPIDGVTTTQLRIVDEAISVACRQLEIPVGVELTSSGALMSEMVVMDGYTSSGGRPERYLQSFPFIECRYQGANYRVSVDVQPAVNVNGVINIPAFPERANGCDGVDQYAAPAALTVVVESDDILRPYVEAQAMQVADLLVPLAVDCNTQLAEHAAATSKIAPIGPMESMKVACPAVEGFAVAPYNLAVGEPGPAAAELSGRVGGIFPGLEGSCSWDAEDESGSNIRLTLFLLPSSRSADEAERLCSAEDRRLTETTFGRIASGDKAAMAELVVLDPRSGDIKSAEKTAREWLLQGAAMARSCADVEVINIDSLFEPLPPYLSGAVEAGLAGVFAVAPAGDGGAGTDQGDSSGGRDEGASPVSPEAVSGGLLPALLRVLRVLMLVVSLAGLALSLVLARKPSRIRPAMEYLRIGSALGGALVMMSVFSAGAPVWAVALALAGGIGLGLLQGNNLTIMASSRGLMAKRSALAIVAFATGLLATQVAGLLNRTGVISIGLALSFLSAAMAAGLIVGRRPALANARALTGVGVVLLITGVFFGPAAVRSSSAQEPVAGPVDVLNAAVAWDQITLIGGVAAGTMPGLVITLDPSFAVAPESVTRDFTVDGYIGGSFLQISGTETYSFDLLEGVCCDILYSATGSASRVFLDGWEDPPAPLVVEEGSIGAFGPIQNFYGVLFDSESRLRDGSCRRAISEDRSDQSKAPDAVTMIGGEKARGRLSSTDLWAPCDLDVSLTDAIGITDPPPPQDSPDREDGGRQCPVAQEVIDTLAAATTFDPNTRSALTRRFLTPNQAACSDPGIQFGEEMRGGTRSELIYYLARPEPRRALEFDRDSWDYVNGGVRNSDLELVCDLAPDGLPIPSPDGDCARAGFFQVGMPGGLGGGVIIGGGAGGGGGGGQFYVFTDYDSSDGPNVIVRGVFPTGVFKYRCHHCLPGDPEVPSMIQSIVALVNQGSVGGNLGAVLGSRGGPLAATLPALPGISKPPAAGGGSDRTANEDAAIAGIIGLIAAMGITAATLAESGLTVGGLVSTWRGGGARAVRATLTDSGIRSPSPIAGPRPGSVIDEFGNPILANEDDLFAWDTPAGTEMLGRAEIEERIAAARAANAARDARHEGIVADQRSDASARQRSDDLDARSTSGNDASMEEIRAGWDRVGELGAQLEERDRLEGALSAARADQDLATMRDTWGQIFSETAQASWNDATEIPGILGEAALDVLRAATTAENWRVVAEGSIETAYDVAGMFAGNAFGDAQQSIQQGAVATGRVAVALGEQFVRHPIDTAAMFIPGRDFADALDGDRTLGQRLGSVGMGVLDIGMTLGGMGVLSHADDLVDAARVMDVSAEAVDAARLIDASGDAAATARAVESVAADMPGRMVETARLGEVAEEARVAARAAVASGNSADAARAMDAAAEAERAAEAARRSLFRDGGMQGMGRAEAAGEIGDELAQSIVDMHDQISGVATRQGVVDAVDDFAAEVGFRPREVMMGNSGSVGAGRSVLTDADRTIVASFSREQLESARRAGESFSDTQRRLQARLTELHQRASELALNSAADPAVILARQERISLGEAVARLGDADDPAAAARRLTGQDMDMASYGGFGSGAGQADAYPMGYTRARQATQGSTEVFTFGDRAGDARSYTTSGQAIIDRNELGQMDLRSWDSELQQLQRNQGLNTPLANAADINPGWGAEETLRGLDMAADPSRIGNAEMSGLFAQQQQAMTHYNDVKSISKAVDRASYVAGRIGQPLPDTGMVAAARAIRANPRATQAVLAQVGLSESEFVSSLQQMMLSYEPVFPT